MPQTSEIEFIDKFGDQRTIRRTRHGLKLKREGSTPSLTLTGEIARIVGPRISQIRQSKGIGLAELCQRAGLVSATPKQRMWEIEHGGRERGISLGTVYSIAIALDVEVTDLLPSVACMRSLVDFTTPEPRLALKEMV